VEERVQEIKGRVKRAVGGVTGDTKLEAEGEAERQTARTKRKVKGGAGEVAGTIKEKVGRLTKNEQTEAEGTAERLRGKVDRAG
jgi:uncharacterized protein YjbJ (UPF0337 family)